MSDDADDDRKEEEEHERGPVSFTVKSTGEKLQIPTPYFSVSQVQMYMRCPRQFWFRYVQKMREQPDFARVMGQAGHLALARANRFKKKRGKDFTKARLIEAFRDTYSTERKALKAVATSDERRTLGNVDRALDDYSTRLAPGIQPVMVEEKFRKDFDGIPVLGFIDLVTQPGDGANVVLDYKFSGSRTPVLRQEVAEGSLQLATYCAVTGTKDAGYVVLAKDQGRVKTITVKKRKPRTTASKEFLHAARGVNAGAFPKCAEGSWNCSQRWCGFFKFCRGARTPMEPD